MLIAANAASLVLLVRGVFVGSNLGPPQLLFSGLALWVVNVAVFALLYWELDGGGPEARADGYRDRYPDLVFPQQQADQQGLASPTWKPSFYDYAYVSFTSSIAFSPTDAMPYSKWAKLVMGIESLLSFADPGRARRARRQHRARLTAAASWAAGEAPASATLRPTACPENPRLVPLRGVAVAVLLLMGEQVAAPRERLAAGDAAERDGRAETSLTAIVVPEAHVVVEVPLRLELSLADLAVEGLGGGG